MNKWTQRFELNGRSARADEAAGASAAHHYFAFLSYSHADSAEADWLHEELEQFRVPSSLAGKLTSNGVIPSRLSPIFRDHHELAAGRDLTEEIQAALYASRCLIVLCSPAAAKSKWTNAEIEFFKRAHPDGCVIAAIIAGDPLGSGDDNCFPAALTQKYDRLGRATGRRAEPLAADLREKREARRVGVLKIVAGILGLGLDDLVQRDQLRRQRRLAAITGGSLLGMVGASILAVTAIQARDEARDQRRQAEGLIGFMLGDLKDKLEPMGRLDVLDGVGARVLDYYASQDTSRLSDQALAQRSGALTLMGRAAQARGNLDVAERFIRAALAGTGESLQRAPDDPQRIYDHAQNVFWLGELARSRGRSEEADSAYREYKRLADRMVEIDPNNLKWRTEELYAEENMGIVEFNHRRFDAAAGDFESALQLMQALGSIQPASADHQKELATTLAWAADAERARGRLDAAIGFRTRQIALLETLAAGPSADVVFRQQLIPAHRGLGILYTEKGDGARGLAEFRLAVAGAERLMPIEPANTLWKSQAANGYFDLSDSLLTAGETAEAAQQAQRGCALTDRLGGRSATTARSLRTICASLQARLSLASGETDQALHFAQQALASARSEASDDKVKDLFTVAAAYRLVGDVLQRQGRPDAARQAWTVGIALLPGKVAERPSETAARVELLQRLGRTGETRPMIQHLSSIGYRRGT